MAHKLDPFETGVLIALTSLTYALKKSPGFNTDALAEAAAFFRKVPAAGCEVGDARDAYDWPLSTLEKSAEEVEKMLENKGN